MKITILHLSDIHIKTGNNAILKRVQSIVSGFRLHPYESDLCLVATSGDIAFSGSSNEYDIAKTFYKELHESLKSTSSFKSIEFIFAPGNHDCNFATQSSVREIVIKSLNQDRTFKTDDEIIKTCLSAQADFEAFQATLTSSKSKLSSGGLVRELSLNIAETSILIRAYNTAWLSRKSERQSELLFPTPLVTSPSPRPNLSVSIFHHPYSWLRADNSREFKQKIESTSDLVLTGHEHEAGQFTVLRDPEQASEYIEGGVLQDSASANSSYNIAVIDLAAGQRKVFHMHLQGDNYRATNPNIEWAPLRGGRLTGRSDFLISSEFSSFLDDAGANFTHPYKSEIKLGDLFVHAGLREFRPLKARQDLVLPITSSSTLADTIVGGENVVISGSEKSGRTALAKTLFTALYARGLVPLYLTGQQLSSTSTKAIERQIEKNFHSQYRTAEYEPFQMLDPKSKAIILDDFHHLQFNKRGKNELLKNLSPHFGHVVILGNDSIRMEDISYEDSQTISFLNYRHFEILELGYALRNKLIERWLTLGREDSITDDELAHQVRRAESLIANVLSRNLVPSHPLFVLVLLQQIETNTPLETTSASYGYFYEVLITRALAVTSRSIDLDTKYTYLADIAYHMYEQQARELNEDQTLRRHEAYCSDYRLSIPFADIIKDLTASSILEKTRSGQFRFKYRYALYYFIARHLRNNPGKLKTALPMLVSNIHKEEEANVLIFLSYLSRDPAIIEAMLSHAKAQYVDIKQCDFDKDLQFLEKLGGGAVKLSLPDRDPRLNRQEVYQQIDEMEHSQPRASPLGINDADFTGGDNIEEIDIIVRLNVSFKTLQILGQILKTSPGSVRGDLKHQIALECYSLGLRTLNAVLSLFSDNLDSILSDFTDAFKTHHAKDNQPANSEKEEKASERAKQFVRALCYLFTVSTLKRLSHSVGLEKLVRTYDDILGEDSRLAFSLVDMCIRLDHFDALPAQKIESVFAGTRGNIFAQSIVKMLVYDRLYMYPSDRAARQRLCEKLQIDIRRLPARKNSLKK